MVVSGLSIYAISLFTPIDKRSIRVAFLESILEKSIFPSDDFGIISPYVK